MYLVYIDEAGNTGMKRDPDQPIHMIGAIVVHESKIEELSQAVDAAVRANPDPGVWSQDGFELHAKDMFSGAGFFKNVAPNLRITVIDAVFDSIIGLQVDVMWSAIDKLKLTTDKHPHRLAFTFLMERVEDYMRGRNELALIVTDENKEVEQHLIDDLLSFKNSSTSIGYRPTKLTRVVDSVHFVQSSNNKIIQCADLVTYFANKALRIRDKLFATFQQQQTGEGYAAFIARTTTVSEKAVLRLNEKVGQRLASTKRFP